MTTQNLDEIVEILSNLKALDLSKLKKMLEEKWGVKAQAAVAAFAPAQAGGEGGAKGGAAAESTDFQVVLTEVPADKKIGIIKVIRDLTGLGLKEAMEVAGSPPKVLKESAPKAEAEEIKKKVEDAGGKVTLKGL